MSDGRNGVGAGRGAGGVEGAGMTNEKIVKALAEINNIKTMI